MNPRPLVDHPTAYRNGRPSSEEVQVTADTIAAKVQGLRDAADETERRAEQVWDELQSDRGEIIATTLRKQAAWLRRRADAAARGA